MSKKKKSLDELLEEALVPEDEQPFEVPDKWVWTRLGTLFKHVKLQKDPDGSEYYVGLEHLQKGGGLLGIGDAKELKSKKVVFQKGDLLYGKLRPYLNKHYIAEFDGVASTDILVYRTSEQIYTKFLNDYLNMPFVIEYANSNSSGINLPRVSPSVMNELPVPLPPVYELKKNVSKIEILFAKIDEAKQLIDEAKETFGLRRAGVLEAALKGELTTSFRKNEVVEDAHILYKKLKSEATFKAKINPDILESDIRHSIPSTWKWVKLGDVLKITSGGTPKKAFKEYYVDGKVPWIKTGEIKWNRISEAEEHITQLGVEKSSAKWLPKKSVLVAMYGQGLTRGRAAILDIEATCNQAVCALLPSPYITPEYLYYYFMEGYNRFRSIAKGGNQENLSATMISEFLLPLPPLKEQLKIVELLDEFFNKEIQVKELLNINVDEIKSAVLSKAFKGELGTNDPTDEPAIELLKSILQEKL
ncbi:restriction endonuclease subunit S [Paenibacillus sp. FSL H7-0442]|uniref:restriction endonuclease subunit S n=1 Tax=Paenibacillus sp. FSL H7-0442 TaxID=2921435 RepID=UPI00315899E8